MLRSLTDNDYRMKNFDRFRQHTNSGGTDQETAIEQCEMILNHLRSQRGPDLCVDFLRIHTLSLLQLIGDLDRSQREEVALLKNSPERLFTGEY